MDIEVYSKIDGVFNPVVKPDPAHVCKLHEVSRIIVLIPKMLTVIRSTSNQ
jgi:hypothetical protein